MRPSAAVQVLINQRGLLLTTFLVFSVILGTAAVARSGGRMFAFSHTEQQAAAKQPPQPQPTTTTTEPSKPEESKEPKQYKYFHEAGYTLQLQHYDVRYFTSEVPYEAHRAALTDLIRSYLSTLATLELETWIAHGTLLGWFWNQHILPWDFDVDVQVSGATMARLGAQYNQTRHEYTHTDEATGETVNKTYLLDVNPFASWIGRGRGENSIDARWIDISTGMYVDITGLMERDPRNAPGVVSCKNFHTYRQEELFPLRESEFEGVPALVPYEYEKILVAEYKEKSLVVTEYEGHRWNPDIKEWVKIEEPETKTATKPATTMETKLATTTETKVPS